MKRLKLKTSHHKGVSSIPPKGVTLPPPKITIQPPPCKDETPGLCMDAFFRGLEMCPHADGAGATEATQRS